MPEINGFELLELLRTSNIGNSKTIPVVVTTASGSCSREELMERGFSGCLLKPFSISELMEVSDKCAMKGNRNEKPDFTSLLSYGNESVMLEKLITETEKEMQAVREAKQRKDLQELDALTHHLRSSWEILRADQPLRELYKLLHCDGTPDDKIIGDTYKSARMAVHFLYITQVRKFLQLTACGEWFNMEKKEIKPGKVFWVVTPITFAICVIAWLFMASSSGQTSRIISTSSGLLLFDLFWISMLCGAFFAFIAWCSKRNQKMKEKDDINDLMRQYLEKKLREEEENGE